MSPVLELDNVSASYSTYRALFGVTFSVPDNGIVALVGSNGAGKSTVARMVSGLVPVRSGSVRVAGEDVTRRSAHRIAALGVTHVPEGRAIFSSLTVEENLTVAFRKRVDRKGVADALRRAYDAFPILAERRKQVGGTLSGGQQRILSLAKVLAVPPRLLIADELSLGLAPVIVDQVYDGLVAIHQQGSALLVVEQQVDRVLAIADRAVLLVKGAVAWDGPASQARPALEARMLGGRAEDNAHASSLLAATPVGASAGAAHAPDGAVPSGPPGGAMTTSAPPPPPPPPVTPSARPTAPPPATPPPPAAPAPWAPSPPSPPPPSAAPAPAPSPRRDAPTKRETKGGEPPGLWV